MSAKDKLRDIYNDCYCCRNGYKQPYIVYDSIINKTPLGEGNTSKNAWNNSLSNTMRKIGKTNVMILGMIPELQKGGKVAVVGCKDPKDITERLKAKGIEVKSEPMIRKGQMQPIYDDEGIIGFENSVDVQTGFLFYCH